MASAPEKEGLENHLTCSIHLGILRNPKTLACQHVFCEECLDKWIRSSNDSRAISCPECRKEQSVPGEGAKGLPDNFKMAGLVAYFKEKKDHDSPGPSKSTSKSQTKSTSKSSSKSSSKSTSKTSSKASPEASSKAPQEEAPQESYHDETDSPRTRARIPSNDSPPPPTFPGAANKSTLTVLPSNRCPVGTNIDIQLMLRSNDGNPITDPTIMDVVTSTFKKPSGETIHLEFEGEDGEYVARVCLKDVGVFVIQVKISDVDIKHSPMGVTAVVRDNLKGTHKPSLYNPHDVIIRDTMLVVTDKSYNRVLALDKDTFVETNLFESTNDKYGSHNITGKFDPYGIAYTGDSFVVTDLANHCVVEFRHFSPQKVFGHENLTRPTGIAVDKHRNIYVADAEQNCIYVFDQDRIYESIIGEAGQIQGQLNKPWFMAVNSDDHLVVAEFGNHRVQVFDTNTRRSIRIIEIEHKGKTWDCRGLDVDESDNIYVSVRSGLMRGWSEETVMVYSPTGEPLGNFGSGFNYVRGLTVTKKGDDTIVYVVDGARHAICEYEM